MVEWLLKIMLPERRYYLSAAGRPKRALRGRCRNSQRAAGTTGGGRTEAVGREPKLPRLVRHYERPFVVSVIAAMLLGLSRIRKGQLEVQDAVVVLQGSR